MQAYLSMDDLSYHQPKGLTVLNSKVDPFFIFQEKYHGYQCPSWVFLEKSFLKICTKFTEEHPHQNVILMWLQSNFIEKKLRCGCSPVNLLHIFRTLFLRTPLEDCFCNKELPFHFVRRELLFKV